MSDLAPNDSAAPGTGRPSGDAQQDRLDSWKEIAGYLRRGTRTAQRWEREAGMPVHRLRHEKAGSVYAFRSELDAWWASRRAELEPPAPAPAPAAGKPRGRALRIALAVSAVVATSVLTLWLAGHFTAAPPPPKLVPLTSYPGSELYPSLSPDGTRVVFTWTGSAEGLNWDLYVKLIGEGDPVRLTTDPAIDASPAWSPDGRWIAFLRRSPGHPDEVMLIPALGGAERKVATCNETHGGLHTHLAWSANSRWLVLDDDAGDGKEGLFLVSAESGERRVLTAPADAVDESPAISPDGHSLAFVRAKSSSFSDVYWLRLTRDLKPVGEPRRITFENRSVLGPAWTADGKGIVYSAGEFMGERRLYRAGLPGATGQPPPELIAGAGEGATQVAIAPGPHGASRLVYSRWIREEDIWRMELPRGSLPVQTEPLIASTRFDYMPQYSPDGSRIAFASGRSGNLEIWMSGGDGSNVRQLTSFGSGAATGPRWSPDSKSIAFVSSSKGQERVCVIASDGGTPRALMAGPGHKRHPSWSRDGKWIYFGLTRGGSAEVWKVPAAGGGAVQVTQHGGVAPLESPDGKWLYFARSGSIPTSLWKMPVAGGAETQVLEGLGYAANYDVTPGGIYYTGIENGNQDLASVRFFGFATGATREILALRKKPWSIGISVHPGGKQLLYAQTDEEGSDLMLVEGFR